jgi:hypothetical protein
MTDPSLILRRANVSRKGGEWQHEDCDVFDGDRNVGRIFLDANHMWFWGVSFPLTGRKSYGQAPSIEEAKAAFRAEYEAGRVSGETAAPASSWTDEGRTVRRRCPPASSCVRC